MAGYSRLMGADEEGTLARLKALRRELVEPRIAEHRGRIVKTTGDGLLIEFASAVDALRCAVEVQHGNARAQCRHTSDWRIEFRIGIHQGDIVVEDGDIFGDGVNIAARLEGMAEPGGICVSARVREDAAGKLDLAFCDLGDQQLKNIARPIRVHAVNLAGSTATWHVCNLGAAPFDRRSAIRQPQQRSRTRIFCRWTYRGPHDGPVTNSGNGCDIAEYRLHLQEQNVDTNRSAASWAYATYSKEASAVRATRSASMPN